MSLGTPRNPNHYLIVDTRSPPADAVIGRTPEAILLDPSYQSLYGRTIQVRNNLEISMIHWDRYSSADYRGLDGWEDTCHKWPGQKQLGCSEVPMSHLNSMCSRKRAKVGKKSLCWIVVNNM